MTLTPRINKLVLTSHITFSVGWLGAVAVFMALAITGLTSHDAQLSRSSIIAMELCAWFVIVPFSFTSLFTGIAQAAWTNWGLFKYYWVVVKLFLTTTSTILLLLHMRPISYLAGIAVTPSFSNTQHTGEILDLTIKAAAAILVLIVITTISVYKPWGKIQVIQGDKRSDDQQLKVNVKKKSKAFYILLVLAILIILIIVKHLGNMPGH